MSSVPRAAALGIASLYPAWGFLDCLAAVAVSVVILKVAWDITRPALRQLVDTAALQKDRQRIRAIVLDAEGVQKVHAIRKRYVGPELLLDLHILVDPRISVARGHSIGGAVKRRLLSQGPGLVDLVAQVEPNEQVG